MQCSAVSPDFRHKISSSQSLWIDGLFNPYWVSEELIRRAEMETHRELKTRYVMKNKKRDRKRKSMEMIRKHFNFSYYGSYKEEGSLIWVA